MHKTLGICSVLGAVCTKSSADLGGSSILQDSWIRMVSSGTILSVRSLPLSLSFRLSCRQSVCPVLSVNQWGRVYPKSRFERLLLGHSSQVKKDCMILSLEMHLENRQQLKFWSAQVRGNRTVNKTLSRSSGRSQSITKGASSADISCGK